MIISMKVIGLYNETAHINQVIGLFQVNLGNNVPTMFGWNIGHLTCRMFFFTHLTRYAVVPQYYILPESVHKSKMYVL